MGAESPALREARPDRFSVIVAHPDDADFGPAGTFARWVREGAVGQLVCLTSGDQGGDDAELDPLLLARTREAEQRAAARHIGYAEVHFLHRPDGALENDLPLREQLVRLLRRFAPDAVCTIDPTVTFHPSGFIQHTDHRAAGMAAIDAVYPAARNPMAFPHLAREGLAPHRVRWLYLFWTDSPTDWYDTSTTLELKLTALAEHASQLGDRAALEERVRAREIEEGARVGVAAAESFRIIDLGE